MELQRNKLADYLSIVVAMSVKINTQSDRELNLLHEQGNLIGTGRSLGLLLNNLIKNMERELGKLSEVIAMHATQVERGKLLQCYQVVEGGLHTALQKVKWNN